MSVVLRAMLAALTREAQLVQNAAAALAQNAPFSQVGTIQVPTATDACIIEQVNLVTDPQGLGDLTIWSGGPGLRSMIDTPPPDWLGYVRATATNVALALVCSPAGTITDGDTAYVYLMVRCADPVTVSAVGRTSSVTYDSVGIPAGPDWQLVSLQAVMGETEALTVTATVSDPAVGDTLDMTAVTICDNTDPAGPFCGDNAPQANYLPLWSQTRNASVTNRHGRLFDMTAVREEESNLPIAPLGLTLSQRQQYLLQRFQSRHQPYSGLDRWDDAGTYNQDAVVSYNPQGADSTAGGTTSYVSLRAGNTGNEPDTNPAWWEAITAPPPLSSLVSQIGDLIRTENAGYQDTSTSITVDYPARAYSIQIRYAATGALVPILTALVDSSAANSIVPCHLGFNGLTFGGFIAGINKAGDSL